MTWHDLTRILSFDAFVQRLLFTLLHLKHPIAVSLKSSMASCHCDDIRIAKWVYDRFTCENNPSNACDRNTRAHSEDRAVISLS